MVDFIDLNDIQVLLDKSIYYNDKYVKLQSYFDLIMFASFYELYFKKGGQEFITCPIEIPLPF
ncbi:MAG: hypothetical protein AB7E61_06060 [Acholeplasmataceae bacterium]